MDRRDLLKLSPLALASTIGYTAFAESAQPPAPAAAEALFNVRTFGATGDGKTVDTPAINKAIEAVAAAGGGTLLFPAGTYVCFTIRLKSNVDLYLSRGCTILAADSPQVGETTGGVPGLRPQPLAELAVLRGGPARLLRHRTGPDPRSGPEQRHAGHPQRHRRLHRRAARRRQQDLRLEELPQRYPA